MRARFLAVPAVVSLLAIAPVAVGGTVKIAATAAPWIALGSHVGVTGTVTPHPAGVQLSLQQRQGTGWITLTQKSVNTNGTFSFNTQPARIGIAAYRVVTSKGTSFAGASASVPIRVLHWSYLGRMAAFEYLKPISGDLSKDPIVASGVHYNHPVSLDAGCYNQWNGSAWIDYVLQRQFEVFTATVGLGGIANASTTATYSLIGAGKKLASGSLTFGMSTKIKVSLDGVYRLRVEVNVPDPTGAAGCGTSYPQVVFGDAQVLGP